MARIYPLFSSSKGNAIFVGKPSGGVLIDCGVSYKQLLDGLNLCGLDISAVKGVFITHEHIDHVKGLKILTKNTGVTVYGKGKTLRCLIDDEKISSNSQILEMNSAIVTTGMEITAFDTPHDAVQSCGYKIKTEDGKSCAVCTDLGYVTKGVEESIKGCELVLLEANYDENMLKKGSYPTYVKSRIRSEIGHLSNNACGEQAKKLIESGTTRIILGHISQENNTAEIAERTVNEYLSDFVRDKDYILKSAPVKTLGEMVVF